MSQSTNLGGLAIPPQKNPDRASIDTRPKPIAKWIANLPMANLGETSRMVFKAMVEINRLRIPAQDRFKSLEALRAPCQYIIESLEKHFIGRPLPLNEKNRKISELARALTLELALGYKIVARQVVISPRRSDQKLLHPALFRSISYLGQLLLRSYQVYAPYPRNVWKELHTIYQFAADQQLLDLPMRDSTDQLTSASHSTIATLYNKILMLSLAMPYRLQRGDISKACDLLDRLIHLVRLEKTPSQRNRQDLFIVNLQEDKQPGYLSFYRGKDFRHCRLINTRRLIVNMRARIDKADPELLEIAPRELLQQLLCSWSIVSKRGSSRTPKQESHVEVAFGLSAAHHYISGEKPFLLDNKKEELSLQDNVRAVFHSTRVSAISDLSTGPDIWSSNYTYSSNNPDNVKSVSTALTDRVSHIQSFDYHTIRLSMSNVSAGGYCLVTQSDTNFSAHIGDLLAIREYNDKSIEQWGVGVIRRMMTPRNGSIELGVQMLTPNAVAIAARLESNHDNGRSSEFMRCLMLPELRAIDQPATIIAPALPFKKDSRIRINLQDKQILASLTQQLERTWSFSQFEFRVLHEGQPNETITSLSDKEAESRQNFDSLWSSL